MRSARARHHSIERGILAVKRRQPPWWKTVGPGIISGAADNDPTTVASLAVIGSTTVYGLGWLVILVIPMLAVVQVISSQIAAVTRKNLEEDAQRYLGRVVAYVMLLAVLAVNFVTLVADIEGGGAAMQVLTGLDYRTWILPVAIVSLGILVFGNYERIKKFLLPLPLVFLAYPIAMILARPDWHAVLINSFVPHFEGTQEYASGAIALLGTTLTAYAYVWQSVETAKEKPPVSRLGLVQVDATLGTIIAGISFWAIVMATGATLGVHHRPVETADQAATALRPFAGKFASLLFGVGLLGSALLAVPVLIATSTYCARTLYGWRATLDTKWWRGPQFYGFMIALTIMAATVSFAGASPIKVLFIASIIGGLATPITMVIMLLIARQHRAMPKKPLSPALMISGWVVTGIVSAAALVFLFTTFVHH
ncbi:MAG: divalent metal cation transporter [Candidatus Eremiobacteraeota bacterium]|nr:divalent metal cation transporter [Candidatus Eremiobacteraeota bacterium]